MLPVTPDFSLPVDSGRHSIGKLPHMRAIITSRACFSLGHRQATR